MPHFSNLNRKIRKENSFTIMNRVQVRKYYTIPSVVPGMADGWQPEFSKLEHSHSY